MKFGKLPDISNVDFSLPVVSQKNIEVLQTNKNQPTIIYIGCTGWSMKEWVGKVYPPKTKTKDYLKYYAQQFNTIELNTTHYRIPDLATIEKWKTESTDDFRFCPKILQAVSHRNDMGTGGLLSAFCDAIILLEKKMGCCFVQLPPYFGADRLGQLENFLERFPKEIPLAVEVRHESWFTNETNLESLFSLLKKYNKSTVITDVAGRRDVLHMETTSEIAMIRFVGNASIVTDELHPTDFERIDEWIERLIVWISNGVKNIYFFCHEPDNIMAPDLCKYLFEKVSILENIETRGPKFIEPNGGQLELF